MLRDVGDVTPLFESMHSFPLIRSTHTSEEPHSHLGLKRRSRTPFPPANFPLPERSKKRGLFPISHRYSYQFQGTAFY